MIRHKQILEFFKEHNLLADAEERIGRFNKFLNLSKNMIIEAKNFSKLNSKLQKVYGFVKNMVIQKNEKNWVGLVEYMLQLLVEVANLKKEEKSTDIDQQAETDSVLNNSDRTIEDIVMDLTKNSKDFIGFAYELIKQDKNQTHVRDILNGNVAQPVMIDIVTSNQWSDQTQQMTVKPNHYFKMCADVQYRTLSFQKGAGTGNKSSEPSMIELENC